MFPMRTETVETLEGLGRIAEAVLGEAGAHEGALVVALTGELGAGKTAFVKALAKRLGVREEVTSPTFVIMKSYAVENHPQFTTLTHIDAYRIESDDEMHVLNFSEVLAEKNRIVCIEWPEKILNLIPEDAYRVSLRITEGATREISYGR